MQHWMQHGPAAKVPSGRVPRPDAARKVRAGRGGPLPCQIEAARHGTEPEDVSRHADGAVGDLAFLARFAFGRY